MSAPPVVLVGNPVLHRPSTTVDPSDPEVIKARQLLHLALEKFRQENGFGRGIACPQIGIGMRIIAVNLGDERGAFTLHNPELFDHSTETFTMWDDCMSFPSMLVKVRRHKHLSVRYQDDNGQECILTNVDTAFAELLQHEVDHLHGITSFERMLPASVDCPSVIHRDVYESNKEKFDAMVDYAIVPTV